MASNQNPRNQMKIFLGWILGILTCAFGCVTLFALTARAWFQMDGAIAAGAFFGFGIPATIGVFATLSLWRTDRGKFRSVAWILSSIGIYSVLNSFLLLLKLVFGESDYINSPGPPLTGFAVVSIATLALGITLLFTVEPET